MSTAAVCVSTFAVKAVHWPTRGRTSEVGGMFSATSIKNTVIDSSVVIPIDTCPPSAAVTSSVRDVIISWRHRSMTTSSHWHLLSGVAGHVEAEQRHQSDEETRAWERVLTVRVNGESEEGQSDLEWWWRTIETSVVVVLGSWSRGASRPLLGGLVSAALVLVQVLQKWSWSRHYSFIISSWNRSRSFSCLFYCQPLSVWRWLPFVCC